MPHLNNNKKKHGCLTATKHRIKSRHFSITQNRSVTSNRQTINFHGYLSANVSFACTFGAFAIAPDSFTQFFAHLLACTRHVLAFIKLLSSPIIALKERRLFYSRNRCLHIFFFLPLLTLAHTLVKVMNFLLLLLLFVSSCSNRLIRLCARNNR